MRRVAMLVAAILLALVCAGCSGSVTKTARGTAQAYVNFMKAGKYKDAALLWDYDEQARRDNENWDEIAVSQRKLIIDKLADDKAETLKMWSSHFAANIKVPEVAESGDSARAALDGGRVTGLDLVKVGEEWRISGMD